MSPETELTFEQAYTRLEELITRLDEGGLSLDEALTCYEEASGLVARCEAVLEAAELRLRNVADREDDGEADESGLRDMPF